MEITSSLFKVNESEIFYNLEVIGPSPSSLRAYIPKLMAYIGMGVPKVSTARLSNSIYCNAPQCKPVVGGSISTQNFVTLPKYPHQTVNFKSDCDIKGGTRISRYHKFHVSIDHGDIRDMYISTK